MKRVLLTGIGGFVGSHVMSHLLKNTDFEIVGIASWKHKGTPERILEDVNYITNKGRVTIITHDLSSPLTEITKKRIGKIDCIVNIASDSHVERSISDPVPFIKNNVNLALNMLEFAREAKPEIFLQFSTDEVYGPAPEGVDWPEWSPIIPSNPYSASKACQEAIAISYWRTYGVPVVITNGMNIFGERQDPEKYLAMCIRKILKDEKITVHGDKNKIGSRFYIHARNVADAILFLIKIKPAMYPLSDRPDRYNIVGEKEVNNLNIAKMISDILMKPLVYELDDVHIKRPGHDRRYALSGAKMKKLGWVPPKDLQKSLKSYVHWTLLNDRWL